MKMFKKCFITSNKIATLAQLVEQCFRKAWVASSSLVGGSKHKVMYYKYFLISGIIFIYLLNNACQKISVPIVKNNDSVIYLKQTLNNQLQGNTIYLDSSIIFSNINNQIYDGQGVTIVFTSYNAQLRIQSSDNITIKNLNINYEPIPHSEGIIISKINKKIRVKQTIGISFDDPIYNSASTIFGLFRTKTKELVSGIANTYSIKNATTTKISDSIFDITYTSLPTLIDTGMYFIKDPSAVSGWMPAIQLNDANNISFQNVTVHSSPAVAFNASYSSNITLDSFKVLPLPNSMQLLSSNRDGINILMPVSNFSKGPFILNSLIQDCGDDALNVRKYALLADTILNNGFQVNFTSISNKSLIPLSIGKQGDTLYLYNGDGTIQQTASPIVISNIQTTDSNLYTISFKTNLNQGYPSTYYFVNASQEGNSQSWSTVSNCTFVRSRRIAILMLDINSNILNNTVLQQPSVGIYASNIDIDGPNGASFSSPCKLNISGNTVSNCNIQITQNITTLLNQFIMLQCPQYN